MISPAFEKELLHTHRQATYREQLKSFTISTSKPDGESGRHGRDGYGDGDDGDRGENGGSAQSADRNVVGVSLDADGVSLQVTRVIPPVPANVQQHSLCNFEASCFPLNNQTRCALYARGGAGGNGGRGGRGAEGRRGRDGQDATKHAPGTNGGKSSGNRV